MQTIINSSLYYDLQQISENRDLTLEEKILKKLCSIKIYEMQFGKLTPEVIRDNIKEILDNI